METNEYILGTDDEELRRLLEQHLVWRSAQRDLLVSGEVAAGARVVDLGCGPGYTTFELAEHVGPAGHVVAVDQSERFLAFLEHEAQLRGLATIDARVATAEALEVEPASFDAVYARWLFSWLPDPAAVVARIAGWLRPGGAVLLQEYLDWAACSSIPREQVFEDAIATCMRSWELGGGEIDVARVLPALAEEAGLVVERFEPMVRIATPGGPEWGWIGGFFESYLPRLVERGLLEADERERFHARWQERTEKREGACLTPVIANLVLRRPAT